MKLISIASQRFVYGREMQHMLNGRFRKLSTELHIHLTTAYYMNIIELSVCKFQRSTQNSTIIHA